MDLTLGVGVIFDNLEKGFFGKIYFFEKNGGVQRAGTRMFDLFHPVIWIIPGFEGVVFLFPVAWFLMVPSFLLINAKTLTNKRNYDRQGFVLERGNGTKKMAEESPICFLLELINIFLRYYYVDLKQC